MPDHPLIRVAHYLPDCQSLGPGKRFVIWVGGCSRRCPGCIADPILAPDFGDSLTVDWLAEQILADDSLDGVTFSGGEPFEQSAGLAALCQLLRAKRDLSLMSYTGFTLRELTHSTVKGHQDLLAQLDILIDGPYVEKQQADLLWRGSANQRLHLLSARHTKLAASMDEPGAGIEIHMKPDGSFFWAGIPIPGLVEDLGVELEAMGIQTAQIEGMWS